MLPAVVVGRRRHRWDFSQGPFQAQLLLKTRNHRRIAASLCCEAGTSLDLHSPELDSKWLHLNPLSHKLPLSPLGLSTMLPGCVCISTRESISPAWSAQAIRSPCCAAFRSGGKKVAYEASG